MKPGFEGLRRAKVRIITPSIIRETVEYAYLDNELWNILQNHQDRGILTHTLITEWFSDRSQDIEPLLQVNAFAELEDNLRSLGGKISRYDGRMITPLFQGGVGIRREGF